MQELDSFVLRDACWYHFQGRRHIKTDCNDNKCVTSTTYDPRAQDAATAPQGTSGQEGGQEGNQENTSACAYHFPLVVVLGSLKGVHRELGVSEIGHSRARFVFHARASGLSYYVIDPWSLSFSCYFISISYAFRLSSTILVVRACSVIYKG